MSAVIIIPARYGSTRFPGKLLSTLAGRPLIQHVHDRATSAKLADRVIVATDSERIRRVVESFGGTAVMTSPGHPSGTDRIAEVARGTRYDIIVNVQGDEPLIRGEMIDAVIGLLDDGRADIGTLAKRIEVPDEIFDPNVVKTVFDRDGFALYFSRAPVPFYREAFRGFRLREGRSPEVYKHLGIYSYRRDVLLRLTGLPQSPLEKAEKLEQLRALENGYRIKVGMAGHETIGVDTSEDLARVEQWLREHQGE
ncbi:MAG: 3-deoxy-manno-octulosonate cytidylyltransferase [Nitrospirae bacterium]|nr:3-deoxy-manno-octulosonate cytidylyltransferase [Nitrospirota bacterium]